MRENYQVPKPQIDEIRDSVDIVDVIAEYLPLKRAGMNFKGSCPFHREKTPSFMVSRPKQIYHCFGCGVGGNVFDFVMRIQNINFREALTQMARKAGIELKSYGSEPKRNDNEVFFKMNSMAAEFYYKTLLENKDAVPAKNYLKGRGITKKEVVDFKLGFAPDSWDGLLCYLKTKSVKLKDASKAGLLIEKKSQGEYYDRFRNRIMFPIFNPEGKVIAFGGRTMEGDGAKYLNSSESPLFAKRKSFYGLSSLAGRKIREAASVIVVEGYMDLIALRQYGIENSVATLGTAFTLDHARVIKRFTENIYLTFDADEAGLNAVKRTLRPVLVGGLNAKVIVLPKSYDPDSFLRKFGKDKFAELMNKAENILDFYIGRFFKKEVNLVGKAKVLEELKDTFAEIPNLFMRELVSKKVSEMTGIKGSLLNNDKTYRRPLERKGEGSGKYPSEELWLIKLILENGNFADRVRKEGLLDYFASKALKDFTNGILEDGKVKDNVNINSLMDDVSDEAMKSALLKILVKETGMGIDESLKAFEDCVERIKKNHIQRKSDELQVQLIEAEKAGDEAKRKEILEQKEVLFKGKYSRKTRGLS